jgi:HTH-type transcriptional regulator/antitoxin HigA
MEANNLRQKDLAPMFGSESVVSEVLRGKRPLNKHHIGNLSRHFKVSPEVLLRTLFLCLNSFIFSSTI